MCLYMQAYMRARRVPMAARILSVCRGFISRTPARPTRKGCHSCLAEAAEFLGRPGYTTKRTASQLLIAWLRPGSAISARPKAREQCDPDRWSDELLLSNSSAKIDLHRPVSRLPPNVASYPAWGLGCGNINRPVRSFLGAKNKVRSVLCG